MAGRELLLRLAPARLAAPLRLVVGELRQVQQVLLQLLHVREGPPNSHLAVSRRRPAGRPLPRVRAPTCKYRSHSLNRLQF